MTLATATDLERWADLREAQGSLPQLVRRLVLATGNGLGRTSMRAGEGVALPGWDGVVVASGADAHVPAGRSVWEMGVSRDVTSKATGDYKKRTEDPDDVEPSEFAFVFVTPRRWPSKDEWVQRKAADGIWREIIVYDADDLETWLERAPHVHAWISAAVGKDPYEMEDLTTWWENWSQATNPPLPPSLVLSGRDEAAAQVRDEVSSGPSSLTVAGDSREEVIAFIAAVLQSEGSGGDSPGIERALIVRTPAAWRRVAVSDLPLVLVPEFDNADIPLASGHGHSVLVPLGREIQASSGINLPRLRRDGIGSALTDLGVARDRAAALATVGRRSLLSLRRSLAIHPELQCPQWARPEHARQLIPAILAGRWNDRREGDRSAISELAGRPYEDVEAELTRWANTSDPPLRRIGNVWLVAAKDDAWALLARHATDTDLDRFKTVALQVVGGDDPTIGMSQSERLMAPLLGKRREHSGHLVEGLADTLALLGTLSDRVPLTGGRHVATEVAASLFEAANQDESGRRWIALSSSLPLLAEAAPDVFLTAAEQALTGDPPPILKLFQDGEGYDSLFGSSAHPSLLWALENVAWSTEFLARAALVLARLACLDPGGRLENRPSRSLRDILLLWRPGTSATLDQRVQVVDLVRQREPAIAWRLILDLIPSGHDSASFTHSPTWRPWKLEDQPFTYADLGRAIRGLAEMALEDVGTRGDRWAALLGRVANLPDNIQERLVAKLTDPALQFGDEDRAAIVRELRTLISRHREFADKEWALAAEAVDSLQETLPRLEPSDPLFRHRWLFQPGAIARRGSTELPSNGEELDEAQQAAMAECLAAHGLERILDWAETFESDGYSQHSIGWALAAAGVEDTDDEPTLLQELVSETTERRLVAAAFVSAAARSHGDSIREWVESIMGGIARSWEPDHKATFLAAVPAFEELWSFVESLGAGVERQYWKMMGPYRLPHTPDARDRAARKLMEFDRAHRAVLLLDAPADEGHRPPLDLVADVLETALQTEPADALDSMFSYHVDRHLVRLEEAGFDKERLARLEWGYLPLFRFENRQMRVLHRALASDPEFFAEVVAIIYPADREDEHEVSRDEMQRAATARDLLDSWHRVPGTGDDGSIDSAALNEWVDVARERLEDMGRLEFGDLQIGHVLRYGPGPQEEQWPAPEICGVIDRVASSDIESGFEREVYNSRGVTTRALTEGGVQERVLAERYERHSAVAALRWPRTSALLKRLSETYRADAEREDVQADLTEDLWR